MENTREKTIKRIQKIQQKIEMTNFPESWWLEIYQRGEGSYIQARWTIRTLHADRKRKVVWLGEANLVLLAFAPYYTELPPHVKEQLTQWSNQFKISHQSPE